MARVSGGAATGVEHPMAKLADVKELMAAIAPDDSVYAAQDAVHWLDTLKSAHGFSIAHRYEVVELMDLALKRHGQRLLDQYLALKPQAKFQEGLLWRAAKGYWKSLGDAYLGCIAQVTMGKDAQVVLHGKIPHMVARALRAQMLQIKWVLMRYGYVDDAYWTTVAQLYELAQSGGFLDDVIDIYGGAQGRGTIRQELLRTLMLGVSSTGGLSPARQNIAERAIAHFSRAFISSTSPLAGCNFFFDLNGGLAPARVLAEAPHDARLYYFGAGQALDQAQNAVDMLNHAGALPAEMVLPVGADVDAAAETLLHLAFNWETELPARDSERSQVATTLQITHGFDGVLAAGSPGLQETWVVENASAEGYGMIVPERRGEWLQVGVLLGFLPESEVSTWGVGVVRRVETDARGQRRVGIQVISRAIASGTLCAVRTAGERGVAHNVVLLDIEPSRSAYLRALLPPTSFTLRAQLEATRTADGKTYTLMPSGLVESGLDFDYVRFKVT